VAGSILACGISCSDTQRIADASGVIRANATESKQRFERIDANAETDPKAVRADAKAGKREQVAILAASEEIVRALPGVKDVLIPAAERREANLAAKALETDSDVSVREWIAARRAADPMFDAAYRRERRDRKKRASAERPAAD